MSMLSNFMKNANTQKVLNYGATMSAKLANSGTGGAAKAGFLSTMTRYQSLVGMRAAPYVMAATSAAQLYGGYQGYVGNRRRGRGVIRSAAGGFVRGVYMGTGTLLGAMGSRSAIKAGMNRFPDLFNGGRTPLSFRK